jgi:ABC-2 type transport system ATP-binding protein
VTPAIEAAGVSRRFGGTVALDHLDLVAPAGAITAVLGPNGAGKSTFVRMVATLLRPDDGLLRVAGLDVAERAAEVRRLIGLAGQAAAVEPTLTGRENLVLVARLYGQDRRTAKRNAARLLEQLDLDDVGDRRASTYSGGMRRRLDLGASLAGRPRLLLLDEPTTGLDPRSRIQLWDAIRALVGDGTDVLLTTQYLDEADRLADRMVIIDHGRLVAAGTPTELKRRVGSSVIEAHVRNRDDLHRLISLLERLDGEPVQVDPSANRVSRVVAHGPSELTAALRSIETAGVQLDDIALRRPSLDEVFLALTGRPRTSAERAVTDGPAMTNEGRTR